tara:strand:+ start:49 stop:1011 length:963 start_codon:yes stop_codon:yes gene_type:complete
MLRNLRAGACLKTNAYRLVNGEADGWENLYVDRLGQFLLAQSPNPLAKAEVEATIEWKNKLRLKGVYYRKLDRQVQFSTKRMASPRLLMGLEAPDTFEVKENGLTFYLSLSQGYSTGLFLDMRQNRQRLIKNLVAPDFPVFQFTPNKSRVLNIFAYTCAFSVCAASAGATTYNIDLSRRYLERGQGNMRRNGFEPEHHGFIYGDALDWMKRLAKRGEFYDLVILDPPTFSRSKKSGLFLAKRDYPLLAELAAPLVRKGGLLLACCNTAGLSEKKFLQDVKSGLHLAERHIIKSFSAPQPIDFPLAPNDPSYLKVWWLKIN